MKYVTLFIAGLLIIYSIFQGLFIKDYDAGMYYSGIGILFCLFTMYFHEKDKLRRF